MQRSIRGYRVLSVVVGFIAALAGRSLAANFINSAPIAIPGPGRSISVSGLGNSLTSVAVGIIELSETHPADLDLVLVGPSGAALVLEGGCCGSATLSNTDLTYSDTAGVALPQNTAVPPGTFKPTQYGSIGSFPSPGPGLAYSSPAPFGTVTFAQRFDGSNPNGTWSLFAMDPVAGDSGQIALGWNLQITAVPEPAGLSLIAVAVAALACRAHRHSTTPPPSPAAP